MIRFVFAAAAVVLWMLPGLMAKAEGIRIQTDFVEIFPNATYTNSDACSCGMREISGGECIPGFFLHPTSSGDSVLRYEGVEFPVREEGGQVLLAFRIGLREGIPWEKGAANGVRFSIRIGDEEVFSEEASGPGWRARAIDVGGYGGQAAAVEFRTNAIDGNSAYDWAVFGEPAVLVLPGPGERSEPGPEDTGIVFVKVRAEAPSVVALGMGGARAERSLDAGTHWLALHFSHFEKPEIALPAGSATVEEILALPYAAKLSAPEVRFSSPLITAGRPFGLVYTVKNVGRGRHPGGERIVLDEWMMAGERRSSPKRGPEWGERVLPAIRPEKVGICRWDGLVVHTPGEMLWKVGSEMIRFRVFPEEPATPPERGHGAYAVVDKQAVGARVGNAQARLCFVEFDGAAYGIAEVWAGSAWKRVGSLYPLARLELEGAGEAGGALVVKGFAAEDGVLRISAVAEAGTSAPCPVTLRFQAEEAAPRIAMGCRVELPEGGRLLAFRAPDVLAGDRAFGARKEFAVFPGLEYLEGDEASSSERDLAYPLCDRRVPARRKVAAPLMAVQGDGALVALLWDMHQAWAPEESYPAAHFLAPGPEEGIDHVRMGLLAPSVGTYLRENQYEASENPYPAAPGTMLSLKGILVLDHESRYGADSIVRGPHAGGLVLQAFQHFYDCYGLPEPSPELRDWAAERALCRYAYGHAIWSANPPGWRHCVGWDPGLFVGHAVPQLLDAYDGVAAEVRAEIEGRVDLVLARAMAEEGPQSLWRGAACHIVRGELPFLRGYLPEALGEYRQHALGILAARENGLWVWKPLSERHAQLGDPGGHTLGQAAEPSFMALRAARLTGDPELRAQALEAMKQMERYEVPRGAQMWECPMYQPDILASAHAIRAYCEAFRLTGDEAYLEHARYWAWTGLPFLYAWEMEGYPTMRYNTISVIGSTFFSHSWLGLPVVWCGLVYAYALEELAEFDDSFPWCTVARGITRSGMWQQYTEGSSAGCYPDSWNMIENRPNPADISPECILMNGFRLRGISPEVRSRRLPQSGGTVMLNTLADIEAVEGSPEEGRLAFSLAGMLDMGVYAMISPVPEPGRIQGFARADTSAALDAMEAGWLYDPGLRAVVVKTSLEPEESRRIEVSWDGS